MGVISLTSIDRLSKVNSHAFAKTFLHNIAFIFDNNHGKKKLTRVLGKINLIYLKELRCRFLDVTKNEGFKGPNIRDKDGNLAQLKDHVIADILRLGPYYYKADTSNDATAEVQDDVTTPAVEAPDAASGIAQPPDTTTAALAPVPTALAGHTEGKVAPLQVDDTMQDDTTMPETSAAKVAVPYITQIDLGLKLQRAKLEIDTDISNAKADCVVLITNLRKTINNLVNRVSQLEAEISKTRGMHTTPAEGAESCQPTTTTPKKAAPRPTFRCSLGPSVRPKTNAAFRPETKKVTCSPTRNPRNKPHTGLPNTQHPTINPNVAPGSMALRPNAQHTTVNPNVEPGSMALRPEAKNATDSHPVNSNNEPNIDHAAGHTTQPTIPTNPIVRKVHLYIGKFENTCDRDAILEHIYNKTTANLRLADIVEASRGKYGKSYRVTVPEDEENAVRDIWHPKIIVNRWRNSNFRDSAAHPTGSRGPRPHTGGPRPHAGGPHPHRQDGQLNQEGKYINRSGLNRNNQSPTGRGYQQQPRYHHSLDYQRQQHEHFRRDDRDYEWRNQYIRDQRPDFYEPPRRW